MRIDKFLKISRILKRRETAAEACKSQKVCVNQKQVKPSFNLKEGDVVQIDFASGALKFRVVKLKESVKKEDAPSLYEILP